MRNKKRVNGPGEPGGLNAGISNWPDGRNSIAIPVNGITVEGALQPSRKSAERSSAFIIIYNFISLILQQ